MGSGKTVVGTIVARLAGARFADLDAMVEARAGMTIPEIFASRGEPAFRALEKELLPEALRPGSVVALGGGAVIDDDNWAVISSQATTVYLEAPFAVLWRRVGHMSGRPLIAGRGPDEVEALFKRRRERYEQALHRVDAGREPDAVAADVLSLWSA